MEKSNENIEYRIGQPLKLTQTELINPDFTPGQRLALAIETAGILKVELARRINMDPSTITRLLADEWVPPIMTQIKIARALGIDSKQIWR